MVKLEKSLIFFGVVSLSVSLALNQHYKYTLFSGTLAPVKITVKPKPVLDVKVRTSLHNKEECRVKDEVGHSDFPTFIRSVNLLYVPANLYLLN